MVAAPAASVAGLRRGGCPASDLSFRKRKLAPRERPGNNPESGTLRRPPGHRSKRPAVTRARARLVGHRSHLCIYVRRRRDPSLVAADLGRLAHAAASLVVAYGVGARSRSTGEKRGTAGDSGCGSRTPGRPRKACESPALTGRATGPCRSRAASRHSPHPAGRARTAPHPRSGGSKRNPGRPAWSRTAGVRGDQLLALAAASFRTSASSGLLKFQSATFS